MKTLPILLSLFLLGASPQGGKTLETMTGQSNEACAALQSALKAELMAAMKDGGPAKAIHVCSDRAPAIAASVGAEKNLTIGRTSLRYRNVNNAPDSWERDVLTRFETLLSKGTPMKDLVHAEIVEVEGKPTFRYMKAIGTGGVCLTCHGHDLSEPVRETLAERYPDDQAVGFRAGEIRGAFTILKPLTSKTCPRK